MTSAKKIMEQDYHLASKQRSNKEKMYYNQARKREARKEYQTGLEPVCGAGSTTGRLSKTVVLLISKEFYGTFLLYITPARRNSAAGIFHTGAVPV